nr:unnamed protein product [Callosobruchus analis]CAI5868440.1 unnamed protein product [Callosobruchus analis]
MKISLTEEDSQSNSDFKETLNLLAHYLIIMAPSVTGGKYFQLDNTLLFTLLASTYYYAAIFAQLE